MSGGSARTLRNFSLERWQDLVLLDIRKSSFQHLTVNWNLNVLEMALKTLHFVQGLSRTPLLCFPRYLTTRFPKMNLRKQNVENRKSGNLKIQKPRFTNKCPDHRAALACGALGMWHGNLFSDNMFVRYRGINNKGVLERP